MSKETADAKENSPEASGALPAKSNLMLIIIIAVLATLLIGGGITGFLLLRSGNHDSGDAEEAVAATEEHGDEEKAANKKPDTKKKSGKEKESLKAAAIYIALEPPFVVNFEASQSARFLQVNVELMTRDAATAALIKENTPLVRNDLLLLFGNQEYAAIGAREGKENLRKQALDTIRNIVKSEGGKPDLVEAVYFTSFVMQ
jgi:flagellar protein FliL